MVLYFKVHHKATKVAFDFLLFHSVICTSKNVGKIHE